jgi:NADH-ubiquinone oxidoreductase chain 2
MCLDYFKEESLNAFESIVLILFSTCNMILMISTYDQIAMYLTIELQSLCFYVITTLKRDFEFSTKAGLKYFLWNFIVWLFYDLWIYWSYQLLRN